PRGRFRGQDIHAPPDLPEAVLSYELAASGPIQQPWPRASDTGQTPWNFSRSFTGSVVPRTSREQRIENPADFCYTTGTDDSSFPEEPRAPDRQGGAIGRPRSNGRQPVRTPEKGYERLLSCRPAGFRQELLAVPVRQMGARMFPLSRT